MWLTKFKIALIEKDADKLNSLMDDIPKLESLKDIEQAIFLLKEAEELVLGLKNKTNKSMKTIQKNIFFLNATKDISAKKLDIKS